MNLLNMIQDQLSPQTLNQISSAVGESPETTKSAMSTALPALLGSLVGQVSSSKGAGEQIYNTINKAKPQEGWPDSPSALLSLFSGGKAQAATQSFLSSVFGPKMGAIADFISTKCGMKPGSATGLLGMAGPLLVGQLGRLTSSQGLGASGFAQLLTSQIPFLKNLIPPQLASTLGIGNLLQGEPARVEAPVGGGEYRYETPRYDTPQSEFKSESAMRATAPPAPRSGSLLRWAWIPLLLVLGGWLLLRNRPERGTGGTGDEFQTVQTTRDTTRDVSRQTAQFESLNLTPGSPADRLAKGIASGDFTTPIGLQGLNFDDAGTLTEGARGNLAEVAGVLKASPNMKVTITCYGASEDAGLDQANKIKSALQSLGVSTDRLAAKGEAGSGFPKLNVSR